MRTRIITVLLMLLTASTVAAKTYYATVTVTYYCVGPCRICGTSGRTATNMDRSALHMLSRKGASCAATHWKHWPKGTKFVLPDGKKVVVLDAAGHGVQWNQIDICAKNHKEAVRKGRHKIKVKIVVPEKKQKLNSVKSRRAKHHG